MILHDDEIIFQNDRVKARFEECEALAAKLGGAQLESWERCKKTLKRLGRTTGALLFWDFAPYSFGFSAGRFEGGLIFHGSGAETFAMIMEPTDGWQIHT